MFARLYPKIVSKATRAGQRVYVYFRKHQDGKDTWHYVRDGECLVVEGGPSTGKTSFINRLAEQLRRAGENVVYIDALEPMTTWVKAWKLFGKDIDKRIDIYMRTLPDIYYLIVDNAEKLTDSKKTTVLLELMQKARGTVVGCTQFSWLNPKIKVRLKNARMQSLGAGADTYDATMFLIVILIVIIAVLGMSSLLFVAAAVRYMFQGVRMGGRKI
jgi:hypothetical protein